MESTLKHRRCILCLALLCLFSTATSGSTSPGKRSRSARDVNAIGHRTIAYELADRWYSRQKEKEMGAKLSSDLEQTTSLVHDPSIGAYVNRLAQTIAANSDARFPISVQIIDSDEVYALTIPAGYQYITRGLLLRLENEGELASALARGIAHTALRSAMNEAARATLARILSIPLTGPDPSTSNAEAVGLAGPLILSKIRTAEEADADYFGIQYLYKSGYDPECFSRFVQTVWPSSPSAKSLAAAFSPFPPLNERLHALEREIRDILPKQDGAVNKHPGVHRFPKSEK